MRGKLEGKSKLDWAEAALLEMASNLPAQYKIGLRAYGHRLRANEDKADQDSELLLAPRPRHARALAILSRDCVGAQSAWRHSHGLQLAASD